MSKTLLAPRHGYHTTSTTTLVAPSLSKECSLHLHYTLPPLVFPDPYELGHHAHQYSFAYDGTRNLELPVVAVNNNRNGSLVLDIIVPRGGGQVEVKVPLHLRYGQLAQEGGYIEQHIPPPLAFTACYSSEPTLPPDLPRPVRKHFHGRTLTMIPLVVDKPHSVTIPVGRTEDVFLVEIGTAITVIAGALYLFRAFWDSSKRLGTTKGKKE